MRAEHAVQVHHLRGAAHAVAPGHVAIAQRPIGTRACGRIAELGLPTVIVQEGGYNTNRLGEYAVAMVKAFE